MSGKTNGMFGLSGEEMAKIGQEAAREARADSFARGLPVVSERNGLVIREYPDGRIEEIGLIEVRAETPQAAE